MSLNQQFYNDAKSSISGASNFIENNSENVRNYGLFKVYTNAIIVIIICIILIYFGKIWYDDRKIISQTNGKVFDAICVKNDCECKSDDKNKNENITYNCNFKVKFKFDDKEKRFSDAKSNSWLDIPECKFSNDGSQEYAFTNNTNSTKSYANDDNITVYYDLKDPIKEPSIENNYGTYTYIAMIGFGFIGIVSSILWIYEARNFSFVAQMEGVRSGSQLVKGIFK
jgi:hypothetical protein